MALDPFTLSSLFAAGTTVFNALNQSRENDIAREYNSEEAQKQRDYNTYLLRNQTQMKAADARAAGLNPAFMNGAALGSTPTPSSSPSSPSNISPLDGDFINRTMLTRAQVDNLDTQSSVNVQEAEQKRLQNEMIPSLMQSQISYNTKSIELVGEQCNFTKEQARNVAQQTLNLQKEIDEIDARIEQIRAQTANIEPDTVKKWLDAYYTSPQYEATIRNLVAQSKQFEASAHLSYEQANDLVQTRMARIFNLNATGLESTERWKSFSIENGRARIQLQLDKDFAEDERRMDFWLKPVRAIGDVLGSFAPFVTRKIKTISTSTSTSTSHSYNQNENWNHQVQD